MKRVFPATATRITFLMLFAGAGPALAQQPAGLEEIIVTAQKRSESIQTVPLSITALSSEVLERQAIQSFSDYGSQIPNLGFGYTGDGVGTSRSVSIRGISGDGVTGFYLDETPLPDSIDPRIIDIDRIEVLRGPQGTLYGARSMGGTVRVLSRQPSTEETTGQIHVGVSNTAHASDPNYLLDGAFNLPLGENVAARAVGFYQRDAGFFKRKFCASPADVAAGVCFPNAPGGAGFRTKDNIAEMETYGGSIAVTWRPTDALSITPRVMVQKAEYNGLPLADIFVGGGPAGYPAPPARFKLPKLTPDDYEQRRFFDIEEGGYDRWSLSTLGIHYDTGFGEIVSSTSFFDRKVKETEDQTDFLYANFLAVSLITGAPGTALPGNIVEIKDYQRFVQELRFASDLDGPLQYVVGGFYSETDGRLPFASKYPAAVVPGFAAASGFDLVTDENGVPIFLNPLNPDEIFATDYDTTIKEPAVFGEISYEITEKLKATVGLRWYSIETTAGGYLEGFAFGGARGDDAKVSTQEDGVNPKFQVDYRITPDHLVYAMAAKGFRPGGVVASVPLSPALGCDAALAQIGVTPEQARRYDSDSLWNYELGTKTGWMDNRLTFNVAAFFIKWKAIQQNVLLPCGFQFRANAGEAESKGFEMEMHARPVEGLDISLGWGHQNAEITETGATIPQLQPGDRVYQVPEWTGNASVYYTHELGSGVELSAGLDYSYVGNSVSANNTPFSPRTRPEYELLDARIAVNWSNYEVALVGKNLADEQVNFGDNRSIAAETLGRPRLVTNQPRTIGIEFRTDF